jgi:hypothetical protein
LSLCCHCCVLAQAARHVTAYEPGGVCLPCNCTDLPVEFRQPSRARPVQLQPAAEEAGGRRQQQPDGPMREHGDGYSYH